MMLTDRMVLVKYFLGLQADLDILTKHIRQSLEECAEGLTLTPLAEGASAETEKVWVADAIEEVFQGHVSSRSVPM